jgi:CspA family cold shock protein
MAEKREVGTVKWFDLGRGYGFIARRGADDIYVNRSAVEGAGLGTLNEGDRVSFTVKKTSRGFQAENLARDEAPARSTPESTSRTTQLDKATDFQFGPDYLRDGYFEERGGKPYLRTEVLDTLAMDVARVLGNRDMKAAQLRRFFNKARGIESKLDRTRDFEAIKADIYGFKRDVAYQVGRKVVPEEFQQFIDRNVELAVQDEKSFQQGFMQHFESVMAYFVYFFREP